MKKGFTILELIAALGMSSIIITVLISMFLKYSTNFNKGTLEITNYFYISEAFLFIKNEIYKAKDVKIYENKIEINYTDGVTKKIIQSNGKNNIVIVHMEESVRRSVNNIATNVKEFSVVQKSNTIYITIMDNNGEKYEKCFGIIN